MAETSIEPQPHAAAAAYQRIDRDLRTAPEAVRPMLRLIRSHLFRQDFNVKRLGAVLNLRSTRDTARFKQALGASIARYIEDRRLETSCSLLVETDLPFKEIAVRVGYRRYKSWRDAFRRRVGCLPKTYRRSGGLPGKQTAATVAADPVPRTGPPRYLAGIAKLELDSFCARCRSSLDPGPTARVFENLDPLCNLCALEHAPRELADFLFVNAERRKQQPSDRLDRIAEPEKILAGLRRQLSQSDADLLIWALLCRYPASAGVVGEIFGQREQERERRLQR
jgi:AraC-like DNA-binding protein